MVVILPMQRFGMRQAGCRRAEVSLPHKKKTPAEAGTANYSFERNTRLAT
jgi:hypothetical protein